MVVSAPVDRDPWTAPAAPPSDYVVQPGDTVFDIAKRFGVRTAEVLAANGLTAQSVIHPGQTLKLAAPTAPVAPATPSSAVASHVVVAGDTVFAIARTYGTTVDAILAANGLTPGSIIYPGQKLAVSAQAPTSTAPAPARSVAASAQQHTVVAGDTLFAIARTYGTTTAALYALNGLSPASVIYPGQRIAVAAAPAAPTPAGSAQRAADLDAEQAGNAQLIIRIGRELGVPERGIAIALATAMVESGMRNLDWGDRDSLGLFQQRPSTGWGSADQVRDAVRSTKAFYGGAQDPNGQITRGLLDIPGWDTLPFTEAAQAVQISAYPDRYGQWETQAYQWLALHG